jgi:NADH-quinone oxidoreductase subunit F/NAD(P)H dehydrogenase (quinone)/NADP-reducing hydrogenase subunit HndC
MPKIQVEDLKQISSRVNEHLGRYKAMLMVCTGTGCVAAKGFDIRNRLTQEIEQRGLGNDYLVVGTGCNGYCAAGPIVVVQPEGVFYEKVKADDIGEIIESHLQGGQAVERLLHKDLTTKGRIKKMGDIQFFNKQELIALRNKGLIDPENIEHYIAHDGYEGLAKVLKMNRDDVIREVTKSGIRGRGGGGFPVGLKWKFCKDADPECQDTTYVICNADEGDPGAFMDRSIIESDPHAVIEGMLIGAYAVGSNNGFVYLRKEYPLALERLRVAIKQAKEYGMLGKNIFGTDFCFDLDIYEGAGAFVCGEETALMHSIEGKRGMPRPRPPYPAHQGLWKKPSVLNNVETFSNIPQIITKGGDWYASIGTEKSKGTKVFAVSGNVNKIGLVEVPMGMPLRELIFDVCGGIPKKRKFKGVQLGGPSGGCVPEEKLDTLIDYDEIIKVGAMMGSGGVIVMDDKTCMVDMARFFMDFVQDESCGKCTPCREGTRRLLEILEKICEGRGEPDDIRKLEDLSAIIKDSSLCGLGQTGPNPVLSTLRYFRHEYEEHINEKKCRAKKCPELLEFRVDPDLCSKCGLCFKACPVEAITWQKKQVAEIDVNKCTKCMTCFTKCKPDAIF